MLERTVMLQRILPIALVLIEIGYLVKVFRQPREAWLAVPNARKAWQFAAVALVTIVLAIWPVAMITAPENPADGPFWSRISLLCIALMHESLWCVPCAISLVIVFGWGSARQEAFAFGSMVLMLVILAALAESNLLFVRNTLIGYAFFCFAFAVRVVAGRAGLITRELT